MPIAALALAAAAYALEFWSAVYAYPIDSGGRPLNSWPIFLLVPFEVGVLAAAVAGFAALLVLCGLPRLHHPLFDSDVSDWLDLSRWNTIDKLIEIAFDTPLWTTAAPSAEPARPSAGGGPSSSEIPDSDDDNGDDDDAPRIN